MNFDPQPCPLDGPDLLYFFDLLSQRDRYGYRSFADFEQRRFQSLWRSLRRWMQNDANDATQRERIGSILSRSKWRPAWDIGGAEVAHIEAARNCSRAHL